MRVNARRASLIPLVGRPATADLEWRDMARYLVERDFPDGLDVPITNEGAELCLKVIDNNAVDGVTWIHSYVSTDKHKSFCIYDAPNPMAIESVAGLNSLPITSIREVRVLDPYFYA